MKLIQTRERRQRRRGEFYIHPRASNVRPVVLDRLMVLSIAGTRSREKRKRNKGKGKERKKMPGGIHDGGARGAQRERMFPCHPPYERSYGQMCSPYPASESGNNNANDSDRREYGGILSTHTIPAGYCSQRDGVGVYRDGVFQDTT